MSVSPEDLDDLVRRAREARDRAYAPYSRFLVGAAILTDDGRVLTGANIENASYGLSMCAERTAMHHAAAEGVRAIVAVAVAASGAAVTWPCGACRQVLHEFGPNALIVVEAPDGSREQRTLPELLPEAFGPDDLA